MNVTTGKGLLFTAALCGICILSPSGVQAQKSKRGLPAVSPEPAADGFFYDGLKAKMKGDDREADSLFLEFVRRKPDEPAAYFELSRLAMKNARPEKALEYIRKAIALDGRNKWYREQYGNILASRNQFEEAAAVFEQLARDEQRNDDYLLLASRLYQRAGKYKEALAALDRLSARTGTNDHILLQQQQIYLRMNDLESATRVTRRLIENNPKDPKYYALLAEVYDNNKLPQKAAEIYRQMEQLFPEDPGTQLSLALYYKKNKDNARYEEYVKKAIVNRDLDAETQISLLLPFLQELSEDSSRTEDALALAAQLAAQHPEDAQVLGFYGDVLMLHNRPEPARVQYLHALDLDPSRFNIWQQLLFSFTDRKDADSLIAYTEKAMVYFPNQAVVHYLNAIGQFNKSRYEAAIRSLNRAVDLQPEEQTGLLADMFALRGDIYHLMKQYPLSDASYEDALKLAPRNATVLNNYSYYLSERGVRLDDAERMSRLSLVIRPDEPTFLDTYGWILYRQGKFEKAESYIRKAIDINAASADATLWEHLGDIQYKRGRKDEAVESWKKAQALDAGNEILDKKIKDRKLYE